MEISKLPFEVVTKLKSGVSITTVAHCVEELVLNSIDAGANCVAVRLNLPFYKIQVIDNGDGIPRDQMDKIGERYATSKCHSVEDLDNLRSHGFRGEALASLKNISSVMIIESRHVSSKESYSRVFTCGRGTEVQKTTVTRCSRGTTITIQDFMYNLPVRKRCISETLDLEDCRKSLERIAISHPHVSVSLRNDATGEMCLETKKCSSVIAAFSGIFGREKTLSMKEIQVNNSGYKIHGFISMEGHLSKDLQLVYVNNRFIARCKIHKLVSSVLQKVIFSRQKVSVRDKWHSGGTLSSPSKNVTQYAVFVLNITCPCSDCDIVLEPRKTSVIFSDWDKVLHLVEEAVAKFLKVNGLLPSLEEEGNDLYAAPANVSSTEHPFPSNFGRGISLEDARNILISIPAKRNVCNGMIPGHSPTKKTCPDACNASGGQHNDVPMLTMSDSVLSKPSKLSEKDKCHFSDVNSSDGLSHALANMENNIPTINVHKSSSESSAFLTEVASDQSNKISLPIRSVFPNPNPVMLLAPAKSATEDVIKECSKNRTISKSLKERYQFKKPKMSLRKRAKEKTSSACKEPSREKCNVIPSGGIENIITRHIVKPLNSMELLGIQAVHRELYGGSETESEKRNTNTDCLSVNKAVLKCSDKSVNDLNTPHGEKCRQRHQDMSDTVNNEILRSVIENIMEKISEKYEVFGNQSYSSDAKVCRKGKENKSEVLFSSSRTEDSFRYEDDREGKPNFVGDNCLSKCAKFELVTLSSVVKESNFNHRRSKNESFSLKEKLQSAYLSRFSDFRKPNCQKAHAEVQTENRNLDFMGENCHNLKEVDGTNFQERVLGNQSFQSHESHCNNGIVSPNDCSVSVDEIIVSGAVTTHPNDISTDMNSVINRVDSDVDVSVLPSKSLLDDSKGYSSHELWSRNAGIRNCIEKTMHSVHLESQPETNVKQAQECSSSISNSLGNDSDVQDNDIFLHHDRSTEESLVLRDTSTFNVDESSKMKIIGRTACALGSPSKSFTFGTLKNAFSEKLGIESCNSMPEGQLSEISATGESSETCISRNSATCKETELLEKSSNELCFSNNTMRSSYSCMSDGNWRPSENIYSTIKSPSVVGKTKTAHSLKYCGEPFDIVSESIGGMKNNTDDVCISSTSECEISEKHLSSESEEHLVASVQKSSSTDIQNEQTEDKVMGETKDDISFTSRWSAKTDPNTNRTYFLDQITGNTSYTAPDTLTTTSISGSRIQDIHVNSVKPDGKLPGGLHHFFLTHDADAFLGGSLNPKKSVKRLGHDQLSSLELDSIFHKTGPENDIDDQDNERSFKWSSVQPDSGDHTVEDLFNRWENPMFQRAMFELETGNTIAPTQKTTYNILNMHRFSKDAFSNMQVIGQVDRKFIACIVQEINEHQKGKRLLVLFDQHAVHERIRLEELYKDIFERNECEERPPKMKSTELESPLEITFKASEARLLRNHGDQLTRLGLDVKQKSSLLEVFEIRSVPTCIVERVSSERKKIPNTSTTVENIIREWMLSLEETRAFTTATVLPKTLQRILNYKACKGAVKFGDKLDHSKCVALLQLLSVCSLPFQCAHGRPSLAPILDLSQLSTSKEVSKPKLWKLIPQTE